MPATCTHCKFTTPCKCALEPVTSCPVKKKSELWVLVRDEGGRSVQGARVAIGTQSGSLSSSFGGLTDGDGVFKMEMEPSVYPVTVSAVPDGMVDTHDLPEVASRQVGVYDGAISHVSFELRLKQRLIVEFVGTNLTDSLPDVVKGATVFLDTIIGSHVMKGRRRLATTDTREKKATPTGATFQQVTRNKYQVRVELATDKQKQYFTEDVQCEVKSERITRVVVPVGEMFTKVRFIGLCTAAVATQMWQDDGDEKLIQYLKRKHNAPAAVPDFAGRFATFEEDFQGFWSAFEAEQDGMWGMRYNGLAYDPTDIQARVAFLSSAIAQAKASLTADSDKVLKVFVAPECFFLGRYGAYPYEHFASLLRQLQDLVADAQWKCWVFAFGTVNGFYDLEGRVEMFNISPVIRGGSSGRPEASDAFVRLLQKSMFSQEIPTSGELQFHGDELRSPLTEETVSGGFQATQNEEVIGRRALQVLSECRGAKRVEHSLTAGVTVDQILTMCDAAEAEIKKKGLYALIRYIRGGEEEVKRKNQVTKSNLQWEPWRQWFKTILGGAMTDHPEINMSLAEGARVMNPRDFSFSMLRMPGPWLEHIVEPGEEHAERKLTFTLEICADHLQGRFMTAAKGSSVKTDIHLVPSAGAYLKPDSLGKLNEGGYAFNCDGWNCPSGSRVFERNGKVVLVENEFAPRQMGRNPLLPHTELWRAKSQGAIETEKKNWESETDKTVKEIARLENQFQEDLAANKKAFDEWDRKGRVEADKPPDPPQAPHKPPLPVIPVNFGYVTVEKPVPLSDNVGAILPYDSRNASDRTARWKEVEARLTVALTEQQKVKKDEAETSSKEVLVEKTKEEARLNAYVNGGKVGITVFKPLAEVVQDAENAKSNPTQATAKARAVTTRNSQIATSREKIAAFEKKLLENAASVGSFDPSTFTLGPVPKAAVPELHIYPEQDLPVPP